ncbi:MAG: hypothetical protein WA957_15865, partial [Alteraurantiacibacter sp.]
NKNHGAPAVAGSQSSSLPSFFAEDESAQVIGHAKEARENLVALTKWFGAEAASLKNAITQAGAPTKIRALGSAVRVVLYDTELVMPRHTVPLTESLHATAENQGNKQVVQGWVLKSTNDRRELMLQVEWPAGHEAVLWERNSHHLTGALVEPQQLHEMASEINRAAANVKSVKIEKKARQRAILAARSAQAASVERNLAATADLVSICIEYLRDIFHQRKNLVIDRSDRKARKRLAREQREIVLLLEQLREKRRQADLVLVSSREAIDELSQTLAVRGPRPSGPVADQVLGAPADLQHDPSDDAPTVSTVELLQQVADLHAAGVLTDGEFTRKKMELLKRL